MADETQPYQFSKIGTPDVPDQGTPAPAVSDTHQFSKLGSGDSQYGWRNKQWQNNTRPVMFALGANKAIADVAGSPVDAATWLMNRIPGVDIQGPVGGSDWLKARGRDIGLYTSDYVKPQNLGEEVLAGAGETTAMVPMVGLAAEGLLQQGVAKAPGVGRYLLESIRGEPTISSQAATTAAAATAGATGKLFAHQVPPPYRAAAETTGQIVGGGLIPAVEAGARGVWRGIKAIAEPFTTAGQEQIAARQIGQSATSPEDLRYNLATKPEEIVPGSVPTTYQMVHDPGLGQLERASANRNADLFQRRAEEQNQARVAALESMKPPGAQPGAVGQFFKDQLAAIDAAGDAQTKTLMAEAARTREAASNVGSPTEAGQTIRAAVDTQIAPTLTAAERQVMQSREATQRALGNIGGTRFTSPRDYGENIRNEIQTAASEAKRRASLLWEALPSNTRVEAKPLSDAAANIRSQMNPVDEPMSNVENGIFSAAEGLSSGANFGNFKALRTRITNEIRSIITREHTSERPDVRRLTMLKNALDQTLASNMDNVAAQQQKAVAAGTLRPEETFAQWLKDNQENFYAQRSTGSGPSGSGEGSVGNAGAGSATVRPDNGGEGTPSWGPPRITGAAGVPPEAPSPVFDEQQLAAYNAARNATQEYKTTYRSGPTGKVLAQGTEGGPYRMADSQVAARFWNAGKTAAEDIAAFRNAVGNRPDANNLLADYAAFDLRKNALNADGSLNLAKYNRWVQGHSDALTAFPELQARFGTAARAQTDLDRAATALEEIKNSYPLRPGMADADLAASTWKAGPGGAENIRKFRAAIGNDPKALESIQDYAAWDLMRDAGRNGALDVGRYNNWMRRYDAALSEFPELKAKFQNAATAQEAVDAASAARLEAKNAYETSAARLFLGDVDPQIAVRRAFSSANPEKTFSDLIGLTKTNPDAANGLKRAVADYITGRFSRTALAGEESWIKNPDAFLTFMRQQEKPLRVLFGDDGYQVIKNVGMDIERANRSLRTKIPGQSNTPQDLANARRLAGTPTLLQEVGRAASEIAATGIGGATAGPPGAITGLLAAKSLNIFSRMKAARMNTINDLVAQAMLNPELARTLLAKVPEKPSPEILQRLAQQLSRLSTYGAIYSANRDDRAPVQ